MNTKKQKLIEVAKSYFVENRTQEEISKHMGISRSQVSRYIAEARERGIVQIKIVEDEYSDTNLSIELKNRYPHLKFVLITPSYEFTPDVTRANLGRYAANFLLDNLQPGQRITLGCGRTLEAMVKALPEKEFSGISVSQAMGNLGHEAHKIDYNEIARITAEKLGGNVNYLSAPAILGAGSISALNFLKTNPMLEKALEAAENADIFIFGIGSIESDLVYTRFGLIQPNELFDLNGKIVGDICGRFFDISGNEVRTAFEDRIIGIGLQKLINAQYSIALGGGTDKAAPLLGAIRGKFINGLVSDEQTIENILSLDRTTK